VGKYKQTLTDSDKVKIDQKARRAAWYCNCMVEAHSGHRDVKIIGGRITIST